jgi:predicted PolB exonuclease-like 3'-5' exonuclease
MGWYYQRNNVRYRFSDDGHLDLADALSDRGATRMTSLDNAARLVGLPGKMGVDGSQVEGFYKAGRLEEIRHYCLTDVIQTACLLCRYLHLAGREPADRVRAALEGLVTALERDGRFTTLLERLDRERLLTVRS